jgi:NAD(P)-dependent dehydrogenase (short-subunit alcohol dehydrogenase family)
MDLALAGNKVMVTGASRGIGRAVAEMFAEEGCDVAICARKADGVERAVEALESRGVRAVGGVVDVADTRDLRRWVGDAAAELGGLDILVSNVSAQSYEWRRSVEVDVLACVELVEAALPYLVRSRAGAIVSIASQAGLLAVPSYKAYSAVKAALISYMGSLSRELAPQGIRVNVVSPGEIEFEGGFWERMRAEDPQLVSRTLARSAMGRFGTALEVARAVVFLASPAAGFISGTNLLIDGGSKEFVQF